MRAALGVTRSSHRKGYEQETLRVTKRAEYGKDPILERHRVRFLRNVRKRTDAFQAL
jgi:hypothetical protein